MKKKILFFTLILCSFISVKSNAQISLGININIGQQPIWGPVGYDYVDYYYLPDIDVYYNVPQRQYVYLVDTRWVSNGNLPSRYRGYDLYSGYKVVLRGDRPYRYAQENRLKYASYKGRHDQAFIRNSRDNKYFENKNHPQHKDWKNEKDNKNDDKKSDNNKKGKKDKH